MRNNIMSKSNGTQPQEEEMQSDSDSGDKKKSKGSTIEDKEMCEMRALEAAVPELRRAVRLRARVGSGTFSVVYAGQVAGAGAGARTVAVKHLLPTAHPARIAHELRCLRDIGGKHNVIGLDLCLRHLDNVVFVMPFIPHTKFSEYVELMDAEETRRYMRALLAALAHVHSFGVIHRDVKPANFLYDRENRRYMLVDFGLAHRVVDGEQRDRPAKRRAEDSSGPPAKRAALSANNLSAPNTRIRIDNVPPFLRGEGGACACAGAGAVCGACAARPSPRAPRAGTQGFRPPEVLLKVVQQRVVVDVWAAGVVLGCVLAARLPLLRASDDAAALAELASLLGSARLVAAAARAGRRLLLPARPALCLRRVCARLRLRRAASAAPAPDHTAAPAPDHTAAACARCRQPASDCLCPDPTPATGISAGRWWAGFPDAAFSLLAALLEPDADRRVSAAAALRHPFLNTDYSRQQHT